MTLVALANGSLFAQRYQIIRCIAQGGMGAVYEVLHVETDRRRALKVMLPNLLQSEELRSRFRLEARVTARIDSEYLVDVLDAGIDPATQMPFLVMEYLNGEDLEARVERLGRLAPQDAVTYLHQASLALDRTHKASIIHRDLKPGNLFLTEREDGSLKVKLLDFGIAKLVAGATKGAPTQALGTPLYMAPEQFHVSSMLSPAADIFSLGMIAYTLLVGRAYWDEEAEAAQSLYALMNAVMAGPKERATARAGRRGAQLPPAFDAWFSRVTALAPEARFPTASAAMGALAEIFGIPVSMRVSQPPRDLGAGFPTKPPVSVDAAFLAKAPANIAASTTSGLAGPTLQPPTRGRGLGTMIAVGAAIGLVVVAVTGGVIALRKDEKAEARAAAASAQEGSSKPPEPSVTPVDSAAAATATGTEQVSAAPSTSATTTAGPKRPPTRPRQQSTTKPKMTFD